MGRDYPPYPSEAEMMVDGQAAGGPHVPRRASNCFQILRWKTRKNDLVSIGIKCRLMCTHLVIQRVTNIGGESDVHQCAGK